MDILLKSSLHVSESVFRRDENTDDLVEWM